MKMPKLVFLLLFLAAWSFQACDKLSEPYAIVRPAGGDTTKRMVLIEDYTGHKCVNCPAAAITARDLEELYEGQVLVMAVHATYFATPDPSGDFTANYMTDAGNAWSSFFKIESAPNGMVNRTWYNGKNVYISPKLWGGAVQKAVELPKVAIMTLKNTYVEATRILTTSIDNRFLQTLTGPYSLVVCMLEDSIISPQQNKDTIVGPVPVIKDYVFMDMLRGTINGDWGEQITASVDPAVIYNRVYTFELDPDWVPEHCWVLAFLFSEDNKEIVHAIKRKATLDPE